MLKLIPILNLFLISINLITNSNAQEPCRANTCRFGECEQLPTGYLCHCEPGIKGRNCDQKLFPNEDICLIRPCWNNGTCLSRNGQWLCNCPTNTYGNNCKGIQTSSSPCVKNNPCKNSGVCQVITGNTVVCFCINDYTGRNCETKIPLCERKVNCYNNGTCRNNRCICPVEFKGEFCQTYGGPVLSGTVRLKNKGGYTAVATLRYRYLGKDKIAKKNILGGQTYTFTYDLPATNVQLVVDALAGPRSVINSKITSLRQCFDVYGLLPNAKSSPIDC